MTVTLPNMRRCERRVAGIESLVDQAESPLLDVALDFLSQVIVSLRPRHGGSRAAH
ncbi:hypothetical protein BH18ACI5_BH18ACI5_06220 [soil metagenome]